MPVSPLLRISQYVAFVGAIFSNCLLLYLIRKRADKAFGRYRIMMNAFSIFSIVYATVEILTQPVMHVYKAGCMFYVDSFLKDYYSAGMAISTIYCALFVMCLVTLVMQFLYRYIAVCKHQKLYYFEGNSILLWSLPPLICFITDAFFMYLTAPNTVKRDHYRSVIMEHYEENIDELPFIGPLYFIRLQDGTRVFQVSDVFCALETCGVISICFGTCVFCATKTYSTLNDVSIRMSPRTRSLNKQLFWTLFLQTLLPCCTQYIPVGLLFLFPVFEVNVGRVANLVGVTCCLYPAMDPLIAIFMIDRFRSHIFRNSKVSARKSSRLTAIYSDGTSVAQNVV